MMKNIFRNDGLYAFTFLVALTMIGCGLNKDNPSAGGTSLAGNASTGSTLYTSKGCAGCHGADASGGIGPNVQGASADHIESISGTGQMAFVTVTAQESADIAAYLETIMTDQTTATDTGVADDSSGGGATATGEGDADSGAALYIEKGCASCHAADAAGGGLGPNIQASTSENIASFVGVSAVPSMAGISLTPQNRADIAAWLQSGL